MSTGEAILTWVEAARAPWCVSCDTRECAHNDPAIRAYKRLEALGFCPGDGDWATAVAVAELPCYWEEMGIMADGGGECQCPTHKLHAQLAALMEEE